MNKGINEYLAPLLRWWWLILVTTFIAGVTSFFIARPLPPIYQARTTLVVGNSIFSLNPGGAELDSSRRLAEFYAALANRETLRDATKDALGLTELPEYSVRSVSDTPFIEISVIDGDPLRAQVVANELATQLILQSPINTLEANQSRQSFVNQQLNELQEDIVRTKNAIAAKQLELSKLERAVEIASVEDQINTLENKLTILQSNYATLLGTTQQGSVNTLSIIEPAYIPTRPIGPNKPLIIIISLLAGFILGSGAALWIEFLDDTLKSSEEVARVLQLPVIGSIPEIPKEGGRWAFVDEQPRSPIADAFRALRTNLEFVRMDRSMKDIRSIKTILVTSPGVAEGKSTMATNLGLIISKLEKKVVLVDADLRKPALSRGLGLEGLQGWSDLYLDNFSISEALQPWQSENIHVIPAGTIPPNSTELLDSSKTNQLLIGLKEKADVIIVDSPPFIISDASVLASKVDGVLLVVRLGVTRRGALQAMKEQIQRVGTPVLGVVVNYIDTKSSYYSNMYSGYQKAYYLPDGGAAKEGDSSNGGSPVVVKKKSRRLPKITAFGLNRTSKD